MPSVRVRDLVIEYSSGGYAARPIDGLSLDVDAGSLVLLLGPSGCGKTSLLSAIGGILTPRSGSIRVGDSEVTELRGRALVEYRRRGVGIVFQAFNLVPSLSALENVVVPMRAAGVSRGHAIRRATELLSNVGLQDRTRHRPGDLSGGQQQRVAIARALALDPPVLLADEPTAHLDYIQVDAVLRTLRELVTSGRTIIVSTHDQRLVPLADRVVEMVPDVARSSGEPRRVALEAGAVLFRQGAWEDEIYVVESGTIEIVGEREDGGEDLRAVVTAGQYFGEIGPLFQLPRSATARARTGAVVVGYTSRDFRSQMAGGLVQPPPPRSRSSQRRAARRPLPARTPTQQ